MTRKRKQSNRSTLIALVIFAVAVFAMVPVVGNWILDEFIYPTESTGGTQSSIHGGNQNAPSAQAVTVTVNKAGALQAEQFVTDVQGAAPVSVSFASSPDWTMEGTQTVTVLLTDAAGNTATVDATLVLDSQAPVITGTKDLYAYVNDTVSYKSGISVTDNVDTKPNLKIDNSQVNLSKTGTYSVTYTATDAAGNSTSVSVNLTVQPKPDGFVEPEVIYARVDALLAKFITPDMTDREKAEAIYVWTRRAGDNTPIPGHFTYSGSTSRHDDYLQAAYEFLELKKGDCFYFYAIQKLMLERLNIPVIDVKKVKNHSEDSNHYWLLVSVDGGNTYYHYDNVWSWNLCLVTDQQLDSVSKAVESNPFNRDKSLYPATPTEALPASALPWNNAAIAAAKP